MNENLSLQLLQRFIGRWVTVDTPVGAFAGILRRAERSAHMGVGNLLLDSGGSWLLVKAWIAIKTSTADIAVGNGRSVSSKKRIGEYGEASAQVPS